MSRFGAGALVLAALIPAVGRSAPLTITERDQDGNSTALGDGDATVDINSILELKLDRSALAQRAAANGARGMPEGLAEDLQLLESAVEQATAAVAPLNDALIRFAARGSGSQEIEKAERHLRQATAEAAATFRKMSALANTKGLQSEAAIRRRRFREAMNAAIEENALLPSGRRLAAYVDVARDHVARLRKDFEAATREQGFYVQLGAWVVTRATQVAVHVPGFDAYPEGERFTVERWSIALTDEQRAQLRRTEEFARLFNEEGLAETARRSVDALSGDALHAAERAIERARAAIEAFRSEAATGATQLKPAVDAVVSDADELRALVTTLKAKYATATRVTSTTAFLDGTSTDLKLVLDGAARLAKDVSALIDAATGQVNKGVAAARKLADALARSRDILNDDLLGALRPLGDSLAGMLGVSRLTKEAAEFGDAVHRLDLGSVPETASLDLVATGRREPNETVLIKLAIGRADAPRHVIATRRLAMQRILVHLDTAAGVLFASPLGDTAVSGAFQAAPSYSLLLRVGSRKHPTINTLWTPGIGLNLTALNFRHEDTPELGVGLVGSFLRDYVQGGIGYNVFADRPYAFFVLGLPLPTLGGSPATTSPGAGASPTP